MSDRHEVVPLAALHRWPVKEPRGAVPAVRVCRAHELECREDGDDVVCPAGHVLQVIELNRWTGECKTEWFDAPQGRYPRHRQAARKRGGTVPTTPKAHRRERTTSLVDANGDRTLVRLEQIAGGRYRVRISTRKKDGPGEKRLGQWGEDLDDLERGLGAHERAVKELTALGWRLAPKQGGGRPALRRLTREELPQPAKKKGGRR